jgi:hypothetical protein
MPTDQSMIETQRDARTMAEVMRLIPTHQQPIPIVTRKFFSHFGHLMVWEAITDSMLLTVVM